MNDNGQQGPTLSRSIFWSTFPELGILCQSRDCHSTVEFEKAIKSMRSIYGSVQLFMVPVNSKKSRQVPMDFGSRGRAAGDRPDGL